MLIDNGSQDDSIEQITEWIEKNKSGVTNISIFSAGEVNDGKSFISNEFKLKASDQKHILIKSSENLGFAIGCNLGIRFALLNQADYIFLLNNDTVVEEASLTHLVFISSKEYKFCRGNGSSSLL